MMQKICNEVLINHALALDSIFKEVGQMSTSPQYDCYGKIIHTGNKADAGHYFSEMRLDTAKEEWFLFNDKEIKKTTDYSYIYQINMELTPYMCLYMRKG